jgi:type IV pilus assembly protein PilE
MQQAKGFTLIEIMVTVAIVAILAAIAMPAYTDYVTRSKISEAVANLSDMRVKMEQFFLDNRTYAGACNPGTVAPLPAGKYFAYDCPGPPAATAYTVRATGLATQGMGNFIYTVDQQNTRVTVSVPTGWTAAIGCWTLKKDGSC